MKDSGRKPLAFISTSLSKEDRPFLDLVESITRENGFEPMGTVGRHSAAPMPIWKHILESIPSTDCIVLAATPRYLQQDIHDRNITKRGISEWLQAEAIIATIFKKPVLIFVLEGTDIGPVLPQITEYITLRQNDDNFLETKQELIKSYFENALEKIQVNWNKERSANTQTIPFRQALIPSIFRGEKAIFVGREKEISDIKRHLTESKVPLSIVGMGGIGKSAVAFKAIRECESTFDIVIDIYFEDGITFDNFIITLAKKLSLPLKEFNELESSDRRQIILDKVCNFHLPLIIADNYENISEGLISGTPTDDQIRISNFIEEISSNTTIIITSRYKNNLTGEELYPISGLNEIDGRDLFIKIAQKHFTKMRSENMLRLIEKLSYKVGGHPLAIKMLAGSYRGGGSSEIESMSNRVDINIANIMEEERRLKSIISCLDYSFNRLNKKTRSLLLKFAFFKSPFSTMAAEIIFNSNKSNHHELFDRSFLEKNELNEYGEVPEKFWLYYFHPVIREYLEEKMKKENFSLDKNEGEIFSKFYSTLIRDARKGIGKENYVLLAKTVNIISEREDNDFKKAIDLIPDPSIKSVVANNLGLVLLKLHSYSEALSFHQECLRIDTQLNLRERIATDHCNIGNSFHGLGELDKAQANYEKALEINVELNMKKDIARRNTDIGNIIARKGNPDKALEYYKKALEVDIELNHKLGLSHDYTNMAYAFLIKGNYIRALGCHQNALSLDKELNNQLGMATDYNNIGIVIRRLGDTDKALEYYKKALEVDTKLDNKRGLARTYKNIIIVLLQKGDNDRAQQYIQKYSTVMEEVKESLAVSDEENVGFSNIYLQVDTDSD